MEAEFHAGFIKIYLVDHVCLSLQWNEYLFPLACSLEQLVAGTINDCPIALSFKLESTFVQIRMPLVLTSKISFPYSLLMFFILLLSSLHCDKNTDIS